MFKFGGLLAIHQIKTPTNFSILSKTWPIQCIFLYLSITNQRYVTVTHAVNSQITEISGLSGITCVHTFGMHASLYIEACSVHLANIMLMGGFHLGCKFWEGSFRRIPPHPSPPIERYPWRFKH